MEYTVERIGALAAISRISVDGAEEAALCRELNAMRKIVEVLRDVGDLPDPFSGAIGPDAMREDTVRAGLDRETVLALSPSVEVDATVVPHALEVAE